MSEQYNVNFKGELLEGFDLESVKKSFAAAFKKNPDEIEIYFSGQTLAIRKNVDQQTAQHFKTVLEGFGARVELEKLNASPEVKPAKLSLIPTEEEIKHAEAQKKAIELEQKAKTSPPNYSCPKCETLQFKSEECISCGIIFKKYIARQKELEELNRNVPEKKNDDASGLMGRVKQISLKALKFNKNNNGE